MFPNRVQCLLLYHLTQNTTSMTVCRFILYKQTTDMQYPNITAIVEPFLPLNSTSSSVPTTDFMPLCLLLLQVAAIEGRDLFQTQGSIFRKRASHISNNIAQLRKLVTFNWLIYDSSRGCLASQTLLCNGLNYLVSVICNQKLLQLLLLGRNSLLNWYSMPCT